MLRFILPLAVAMMFASSVSAQDPVSSIFTYQAELRQSGAPVTTAVDLRFRLYDAATLGNQIGMQLTSTLTPTSGRFTTDLNFGGVFAGQNHWLEVDVRLAGGPTFTTLTPRQPLYATPNASFALNAATATSATNATQLNGQLASFYTNAANLTGTIPGGLLAGTYANPITLSSASNSFAGSGAGLINLDAGNIATGILPLVRGGTGAGTAAAALSGLGGASLTSANIFTLGPQTFQPGSPGNRAILVRGSAGQTANLQEWQTFTGAPLASISGTGTTTLRNDSAASTVLIVRVIAGQSASIQEWQNNLGTVLASISNTGQINGSGSGLLNLNASNLSIGTVADARLSANIPRLDAANAFSGANSFAGLVHSTTTGYRFPDNTIQTTAALDPGDLGFSSGYPAGSTMTVTINGVMFPTARMVGSWRINRPTSGGPQWTTPPTLRRARTTDNTWFNWVQSGTLLSGLRITVTIPGGATVDYDIPTGRVSSYRLLTADDGLPFEEITYICGTQNMPSNISTLSGSATGVLEPTVAPRLGESTGTAASTYRPVWNNVRSDVVRIVGNPAFPVPIDPITGNQSGQVGSATVTVRANALAAALNLDGPQSLTFRLVLHPSAGADIDLTNNVPCSIVSTMLRLADDGLPVEEYEITFPFIPPP